VPVDTLANALAYLPSLNGAVLDNMGCIKVGYRGQFLGARGVIRKPVTSPEVGKRFNKGYLFRFVKYFPRLGLIGKTLRKKSYVRSLSGKTRRDALRPMLRRELV
jgi:hypothetical protein